MTRTSQLEAHYACMQVDALLERLVLGYVPTRDVLTRELSEQIEARWGDPTHDMGRHVRQRVRLLSRLRAGIVAAANALAELRADLGVANGDLPDLDDAVRAELERLRNVERAGDEVGGEL